MKLSVKEVSLGFAAIATIAIAPTYAIAATRIVDAGFDSGDAAVADIVETAEQRAFRAEYIARTVGHIYGSVKRETKVVTPAEVKTIDWHWRQSMRVLRIREIAQAEGDKVTMGRADDLLNRIDGRFYSKLDKLVASAPDKVADAGSADARSEGGK